VPLFTNVQQSLLKTEPIKMSKLQAVSTKA